MVQSTEREKAPGQAGAAPAQPPPPPAAAPAAAAAPAGLPTADERPSLRMAARADVDRAERDLDAAMTSCESACRALASMDRATTNLCSLADERDDQRRCDDARQRLAAARARVRAACGACP
jgi:predicted lipid-binding transport protein (Tim44 family)